MNDFTDDIPERLCNSLSKKVKMAKYVLVRSTHSELWSEYEQWLYNLLLRVSRDAKGGFVIKRLLSITSKPVTYFRSIHLKRRA